MEKKTDLRVIKTKRLLYKSLSKLLREKSFEQIKISDICNEALINRSTFYAHFNDKYELLNSFIYDLKDDLQEQISSNEKIDNLKNYYINMITVFLNHIDKNLKLVKKSDIPSSFVSDFYTGAILNVGINYLKDPKQYKKEKIVAYLNKLLPDDI